MNNYRASLMPFRMHKGCKLIITRHLFIITIIDEDDDDDDDDLGPPQYMYSFLI